MPRTFSMHPREPYQTTARRPYASYDVVDGRDGPFVVLTIGDHHGDEAVLYIRDQRTLKRIQEAAGSALFALENSRPLKVDMSLKGV